MPIIRWGASWTFEGRFTGRSIGRRDLGALPVQTFTKLTWCPTVFRGKHDGKIVHTIERNQLVNALARAPIQQDHPSCVSPRASVSPEGCQSRTHALRFYAQALGR